METENCLTEIFKGLPLVASSRLYYFKLSLQICHSICLDVLHIWLFPNQPTHVGEALYKGKGRKRGMQ